MRRPITARIPDALWSVLSVSPAVFLLLALTVIPIGTLFWMTVHSIEWRDGTSFSTFVGLKHYVDFVDSSLYWKGLKNTVVFAISAVPLQMLLGFCMAFVVSRSGSGARTLLTVIFLLPIVIPPIVIGAIWSLLLEFEFGKINDMFVALGGESQHWLGDKDLALPSVIFVDVWHWTPFVFLLMLAGIESLPQEIYEAAKLDVKTIWQELRHITVPLMLPTILITLIFRMILTFKVFDEIFLLTSGGPGTATEVVSFSIYRTFFAEDKVGLGAVMSIFTMLFVTSLAILAQFAFLRIRKR